MRIYIKKQINESAFTLVELLVSVAIVGILTSIAVPAFKDYKAKAYDSQIKVYVVNGATAAQAFLIDHPVNTSASLTNGRGTLSGTATNFKDLMPGAFLDEDIYFQISVGPTSGLTLYDSGSWGVQGFHCSQKVSHSSYTGSSSHSMMGYGMRQDDVLERQLHPISFGGAYTHDCT